MIGEKTKESMRRLGGFLFPAGIVMLLLGTGIQLFFFITSEGRAPTMTPNGMIWAGILAALGIPAIVGGKALQMVANWKSDAPDATDLQEDALSESVRPEDGQEVTEKSKSKSST